MSRSGFLAVLACCAFAAPVCAQGVPGLKSGALESDKESRDLARPPSNPGIAAPLDIRIQGEGISLPPGVADDVPLSKPAEERAPQRGGPVEGKAKPEAKRP